MHRDGVTEVWTRNRPGPPRISFASGCAVAASAAGSTWLSVSMVMPTFAWSSRSLMTFPSCRPVAFAEPAVMARR